MLAQCSNLRFSIETQSTHRITIVRSLQSDSIWLTRESAHICDTTRSRQFFFLFTRKFHSQNLIFIRVSLVENGFGAKRIMCTCTSVISNSPMAHLRESLCSFFFSSFNVVFFFFSYSMSSKLSDGIAYKWSECSTFYQQQSPNATNHSKFLIILFSKYRSTK